MALVGSALVAYPSVAGAQPTSGMRRVGVLMAASESADLHYVSAFRQGLAALGWTEGRNLTLDVRYGNRQADQTAPASALAALKPEVVLAFSALAVIALRRVAGAVPIVFVDVNDPVASGFVHAVARPGGTITGFANYDPAMGGKWFQLLREVAPRIRRVAILYSPSYPTHSLRPAVQAAARGASIETVAIRFETAGDVSRIVALGANPPTGLILLPGAGLPQKQDALIKTAATLRLPVVSGQAGVFTARGGLMSYNYDVTADMRRAAGYVDRILHGEKAGDLPVQYPDSFRLSINLKTAKQLGLVVPQSLLVSANELIR